MVAGTPATCWLSRRSSQPGRVAVDLPSRRLLAGSHIAPAAARPCSGEPPRGRSPIARPPGDAPSLAARAARVATIDAATDRCVEPTPDPGGVVGRLLPVPLRLAACAEPPPDLVAARTRDLGPSPSNVDRRRPRLDGGPRRDRTASSTRRTAPAPPPPGAAGPRPALPTSRSSHAVPTNGCPASGSSTSGVRIRISPRRRSSTNTVSAKPSSAATAWRSASGTAAPSRKTPSGFPPEPSGAQNTRRT